MRSKNYLDQIASFTPLEPQQMVRVALVEGLKPRYENGERQRYRRLLKEYTDVDDDRINALFRIMKYGARTKREAGFLRTLIDDVRYTSGKWKSFEYPSLKKEGVIIEYSGDNQGLVDKVLETDENHAIFVQHPIAEEGKDYLKHIDWRNKMVLNGPDVIIQFAKDRGIEDQLPETFLKYRRPNEVVYKLLEKHGFTYTEALKTAIKVMKTQKYLGRTIAVWAIKNPNGNEFRQHPHDHIESPELFVYAHRYAKPIIQELGDLLTPYVDKYYGLNRFSVPKRVPENEKVFNSVETHYLPDFGNASKKILEWMHTVTECDCGNALNLRNFEDRKGRKAYIVQTFETHAGVVVLEIHYAKGINANESPNNLNPLPTPEFSRFVDKLRYNLAEEIEIRNGEKTKIHRRYAGEIAIEILINELAKKWTAEEMFFPDKKVGTFLLKPMYWPVSN